MSARSGRMERLAVALVRISDSLSAGSCADAGDGQGQPEYHQTNGTDLQAHDPSP